MALVAVAVVVEWVTLLVGCGWWVTGFSFQRRCGFAGLRRKRVEFIGWFASEKREKEMKKERDI